RRRSSGPLQLAMPLGVHLTAVEDRQAERNADRADDQERPDVVPERPERRAVEDRARDPVERVRRGGDLRQPLHPPRQDLDRVVDARDDEQHALGDEPELGSLLRGDERQDRGHHTDDEARDGRDDEDHERRREVRVLELQAEEQRDDDEQQDRADEPVAHREDARTADVHGAGERRHERVLDRALPPLPGDRLREELEDDPEVRPDDRPDQERGRRAVDVDRAAGGLDPLRDEDDRERVGDRPDEEREVPVDVAPREVDVPLDDAGQADQLMLELEGGRSHARTLLSSASISSSSSSNPRPVAAKNASSSVSASNWAFSCSAGSSASSRPRSRIPTRPASASASPRSWVQRRI